MSAATSEITEPTTEPEPVTEPATEPVTEPVTEPEPDEPAEPVTEPVTEPEGRCEAETTVGGILYRCALDAMHEDEHAFSPVDADAEPPEPPGAWAPRTDKEVAKAQDLLGNEAERHAKRVKQILGADADDLVQCALCSPAFAGWRTDAAPTPEVVAAVRVAIGLPDVSNFLASDTEATCRSCGGLGEVRTGSLVPRFETAKCDACKGRGYMETRPRQGVEPGAEIEPALENGDGPPFDDGVTRDMFGTPITDPDYGKMPALRERPIEYWQSHRS